MAFSGSIIFRVEQCITFLLQLKRRKIDAQKSHVTIPIFLKRKLSIFSNKIYSFLNKQSVKIPLSIFRLSKVSFTREKNLHNLIFHP